MSHNENLFKGSIGRTYQESQPWWPDELSAPKGAPNIVIVVLDDVGFADAHYGAAGPQDNWPLGRGFGRWYGFHGALTDQWNPELYQDNRPIHLHPRETYHLSADLVDHAIADIRVH